MRRNEFEAAPEVGRSACYVHIAEFISAPAVRGSGQIHRLGTVPAIRGERLEAGVDGDETRMVGAHHGCQHG